MSTGDSAFLEDEDDDESDFVLLVDAQEPGERYVSLEDLEEGYGDESDGPDHDGYTARDRELREVGGLVGMSMAIVDAEQDDFEGDAFPEDPDYGYGFDE
jgi:hypothetical protein